MSRKHTCTVLLLAHDALQQLGFPAGCSPTSSNNQTNELTQIFMFLCSFTSFSVSLSEDLKSSIVGEFTLASLLHQGPHASTQCRMQQCRMHCCILHCCILHQQTGGHRSNTPQSSEARSCGFLLLLRLVCIRGRCE